MAQKKYLDMNGLLYTWNKIKSYIDALGSKKVDKIEGKGLSTNDLTDELKQKILDAGSSSFTGVYDDLIGKPKINGVEVNGELTSSELKVADKVHKHTKADITDMPTKLSQFTNDSDFQTGTEVEAAITSKGYQTSEQVNNIINKKGYQTAANVETIVTGKGYQTASQVESAITGKGYQTAPEVESAITSKGYQTSEQVNTIVSGKGYQTAQEVSKAINDAVGKITGFEYEVLEAGAELPPTGKKGVIYLKPIVNKAAPNIYEEFIWVNNAYEIIGTTAVDLSGYLLEADLVAISNGDIDGIIAD